MTFTLPGFDLDTFIASTLAEDLGPDGRDVTSEAVIPADAIFEGVMDSRDAVTLAGLPIAAAFFRALDPDVEIELLRQDGITGMRAWARMLWFAWVRPGMMRKILGAWLAFFLPGFHPWNHDDRALIGKHDSEFADAAMA